MIGMAKDGGTVLLDRAVEATAGNPPKAKEDPEDKRTKRWNRARVVSVITRETARVGGHEVQGETEPRHDGAYDRHAVRLRREGEIVVNANDFEFNSSLDWPGPVVGFLVHDEDGKVVGRSDLAKPLRQKAGLKIVVREGKAAFVAVDRQGG